MFNDVNVVVPFLTINFPPQTNDYRWKPQPQMTFCDRNCEEEI